MADEEPKPESKVQMDPVFELRLRELKEQAEEEGERGPKGEQVTWYRPEDYESDLFDLEAMADPFDRSVSNEAYGEAIKDPSKPGVSGDLITATSMVDYLATLERAFRMRLTMQWPRAMAHAMGRQRGQGSDKGVYTQCGVEFLRSLLERSKQSK